MLVIRELTTALIPYSKLIGFAISQKLSVLEHTHHASDKWESDETGHWHSCSCCDVKADFRRLLLGFRLIIVPRTV